MKTHNGMRPQDIVVLLKIASMESTTWMVKDLAFDLGISQGEVSESLNRSSIAGLLSKDKKTLMRGQLLEFLQFGLKYVFPQRPGAIVKGIPTAHSAPPLNKLINSSEFYVWADANGGTRGQKIEPLYPKVPEACQKDSRLYELLALADALRVGNVREQNLAIEELKKRILND